MRLKGIVVIITTCIGVLAGLFVARRFQPSHSPDIATECAPAHPVAADFSLTSLDGDQIRLNDYRGKVVLLNFWASWCGPCRMEIPGLKELQRKYGDKGFRVIGMDVISEDQIKDVRDFDREFRLNYPVVFASDKLGEQYGGLIGTPTTVLIGCDGRIYGKYIGFADETALESKVQGLLASCRNG